MKDKTLNEVLKGGKKKIKQSMIDSFKEFAEEIADECADIIWETVNTIAQLTAENAELKARLEKAVELPCKVGDRVYGVAYIDCALEHAKTEKERKEILKVCDEMSGYCEKCKYSLPAVEDFVCTQIQIGDCGIEGESVLIIGKKNENYTPKNIFTNRTEAEKRLAELQNQGN